MAPDKDIRFTNKRVDESWKEQAGREKRTGESKVSQAQVDSKTGSGSGQQPVTSKVFLNFLTSLGFQALMHLGEIENPQTGQSEINLEAAKEIIDLLGEIKKKTSGNLSAEESQILESVVPELQMKFAQKT